MHLADTPEGAKVLRWKRQCRLPRLLVGRKSSEKYENTFRVQRQPSRLIPRESLIGGVPHLRVCVILISSSASVNICIFVSFFAFQHGIILGDSINSFSVQKVFFQLKCSFLD